MSTKNGQQDGQTLMSDNPYSNSFGLVWFSDMYIILKLLIKHVANVIQVVVFPYPNRKTLR